MMSGKKKPNYFSLLEFDCKKYNYPNAWNPEDKCSLLDVSFDNLMIEYIGTCCRARVLSQEGHDAFVGEGKSDSEAASIRTSAPIPPQMGIFYYEITVLRKGRDGYIGIGISTEKVSLVRLPGATHVRERRMVSKGELYALGWENDSYGYHGDDGNFFCASGLGKSYGPLFTTGDVVGCGLNMTNGELFYTKNGQFLGTRTITLLDGDDG